MKLSDFFGVDLQLVHIDVGKPDDNEGIVLDGNFEQFDPSTMSLPKTTLRLDEKKLCMSVRGGNTHWNDVKVNESNQSYKCVGSFTSTELEVIGPEADFENNLLFIMSRGTYSIDDKQKRISLQCNDKVATFAKQ